MEPPLRHHRILSALALPAALAMAPAATAYSQAVAYASAYVHCVQGDQRNVSDSVFALTLASSSGSFGDPNSCEPESAGTGSLSAGAVVFGSLRHGTLSAYAEASGAGDPLSYNPGQYTNLAVGSGVVSLYDAVTVVGPNPSFSVIAQLGLHIEGNLEGYSSVYANILVGSAQSAGCVNTYESSCGTGLTPVGPFAFDLTLPISVSSSNPTFQLFVGMSASAVNSGAANASQTATLSIVLPEGFWFTSESEMLLVPEPGPIPLLASAALAGWGLARGARASRA
jgi:hypothetical protein